MNNIEYKPGNTYYPFLIPVQASQEQIQCAKKIDELRLSIILKYNLAYTEIGEDLWFKAQLISIITSPSFIMTFKITDAKSFQQPYEQIFSVVFNAAGQAVSASGITDARYICDVNNTYCTAYELTASTANYQNLIIRPQCLLYTYYGPELNIYTACPDRQATETPISSSYIPVNGSLNINRYGYNVCTYITSSGQLVFQGSYGQGLGYVPNLRAYTGIISEMDSRYQAITASSGYIQSNIIMNSAYSPDQTIVQLLTGLRNINGLSGDVVVTGGKSVTVNPTVDTSKLTLTISVTDQLLGAAT